MASPEELLCNFIKSRTPGKIKISFESGSKKLSTVLNITIENNIYRIKNNCIDIESTIPVANKNAIIKTIIARNTEERKCFTPILKSNNKRVNESIRRSTTDILQVLKTKLALCIPGVKDIFLTDAAHGTSTKISDLKILRGEDGLYERYGYKSDLFNTFKDLINETKWGDIYDEDISKIELYIKNLNIINNSNMNNNNNSNISITLGDYILEKTGKTFDDDLPITEVMKEISNKDDDENDITKYIIEILLSRNEGVFLGMYDFTLDKESPEWKKWDSEFKITSFELLEEAAKGGRRKTRKRTRKHRNKSRKQK